MSMRKASLIIILFFLGNVILCSQVLDPKWLPVIKTSDQKVYLDTTNIKRVAGQVTVVSLTQFDKPQYVSAYKKEAQSIKSQVLFNLVSKKYTVLGSLFYDTQLKIIGESSLPGFSLGNESFAITVDSNMIMKALYQKAISILNIDTTSYYNKESVTKEEKLRSLIDNTITQPVDSPNVKVNEPEKIVDKKPSEANNRMKENPQTSKQKSEKTVGNSETSGGQVYNLKAERNIKGTIFTDGNKYCLQLSSWKIKSRADKEVARLKSKGENAFIVEANIPSKGGTWYRVRVGYFNSLEETENYLQRR